MNNFTITESAEGEFILSVQGRGYVCRQSSYDEAIRAYEDYLIAQGVKNQHCS